MVREVDVETLAAALERGTVLIDVREAFEYTAGHVPGARWIPLGMLSGQLAEIPRGGTVMVVCASGNRSRVGAELLSRAGIDAVSVAGGTAAWASSGRALEQGTGAPAGSAAR